MDDSAYVAGLWGQWQPTSHLGTGVAGARSPLDARLHDNSHQRVTLAAQFMVWDGYGSMAEYLALAMAQTRIGLDVVPLAVDPAGLSPELGRLLEQAQPDPDAPVVWFAPPIGARERFPRTSRLVINTMWESDRLPASWLRPMNECDDVVVPTRFVADVCRREGLSVRLEVIPEGIDPAVYRYVERPQREGLTTLAVGPLVARKHPDVAIAAWKLAFGNDPEARLILKSKFDLGRDTETDPRITIISSTERTRGILHWYEQADVLVALGNEGFGLPLVEGMATGLPVIALNSEGQADVCTDAPDCILPVGPSSWEACDDTPWGRVGKRGVPGVEDVAARLRWVDTHRDEARELGQSASAWAHANRNIWTKGPRIIEIAWPDFGRITLQGKGRDSSE